METRFQTTSFIPKSSLDNVVDDHGKIQKSFDVNSGSGSGSGSPSLFLVISFFLFICSVVAAGAVFSLNQLSISQKSAAVSSLAKSQEDINKDTIEELKNLNTRLDIIKTLLDRHVAVSSIFNELSKNTIKQVSFSSFNLKRKADNIFTLSLSAQGVGYESIVAQDSQLSSPSASRVFKNTSITNFVKTRGQDLTSFGIETNISSNAINFSEVINNVIN